MNKRTQIIVTVMTALFLLGCELPFQFTEDHFTDNSTEAGGNIKEVTFTGDSNVLIDESPSTADDEGGIITGPDADSNLDKDQQTEGIE